VDGGRYDEGIAILADDVTNRFARFAKDPMWLVNLTGAVRVAVVAGQDGRSDNAAVLANALYDLLAPFWTTSSISMYSPGLRSPTSSAYWPRSSDAMMQTPHFAHALDIATRIEAPLFAAMTRIEWGAFRLTRGESDPEDARTLVNHGLETAAAARAGGIERRAREVIEQRF